MAERLPAKPRPRERAAASDHAVVRYLERVWGVDLSHLRARIERIAQVAVDHEAEAVVVRGMRFVVRDGVVVTIEPARGGPRRRRRR